MSYIRSAKQRKSIFYPISQILKLRKYQIIVFVSAIIYALVYMFVVGIIAYYPGLAPDITGPVVHFFSYGISIVPFSNFFIFIFYNAIFFLTVASFLVGLNISLLFYSKEISKKTYCCRISKKAGIRGTFGVLPSFFTSFACCGNGLLTIALGPTVFSALSIYSSYIAPVTLAALGVGIYFSIRQIRRNDMSISICSDL